MCATASLASSFRRCFSPAAWCLAATLFFPSAGLAAAVDEPVETDVPSREPLLISFWERKFDDVEREFQAALAAYKRGQQNADEVGKKFDLLKGGSLAKERLYDEWVKRFPKSYAARTARGMFYKDVAWTMRGTKYAHDTSAVQFENFTTYLRRAEADLRTSILMDSKPVQSHWQLIWVSLGLGLREERGFLDAVLRLDPAAFGPRNSYLIALSPKWGGSFAAMDEFVAESRTSAMTEEEKMRLEANAYSLKAEHDWRREEYQSAIEHYKKAFRLYPSDVSRLYWAARAAESANLKDTAFTLYMEVIARDSDYVWALTRRGYLYETYHKDDLRAFQDYLAAADKGNSWAQNRVGWWYLTGHAVEKDYDKAEHYLGLAAAQGNKTAKKNLSSLDSLKKRAR